MIAIRAAAALVLATLLLPAASRALPMADAVSRSAPFAADAPGSLPETADPSRPPAGGAPAASASTPAARQVLVMLRSPTAHARVDGTYGGSYGDAARARSQARVGARLAAAHGFGVVTQWPLPTLGLDCVVLSLPPGADLAAGIAALEAHAEVAWAQPMNEFQAQAHADPLYPLQPSAVAWRLDDLHAVATGRRMHVAVLDSGVDDRHPDLAQAVETRENFVDGQAYLPEFHGTAVAGLIAARADNGMGMVGIAPDAQLLALRACWEVDARRTLCNSLSLAKALSFAIERRAEVINMSLSGPTDLLLGRLIDVALARRLQVVAAVDPAVAGGGFPATHPGVIAVSDSALPLPLGSWSAPARDLPAPTPGGGWRLVSGSSFAAGQVSGLLAVLDQARADAATGGRAAPASTAEGRARLVRLPGGGIDACASLATAAAGPGAAPAGAAASPAPGCRPLLAVTAILPGP